MLEVADVPYVGSDVESSAVCLDKLVFKRLLRDSGLPQVDFCEAGEAGWRGHAAALQAPLWVKPARLGSSVGISKVEDPRELDAAIELARRHDPRVIVEASGEGGGRVLRARPLRADRLGSRRDRGPRRLVRLRGQVLAGRHGSDRPRADRGARNREAARARRGDLRLCGCSGLARCDFFVDADSVLINELNTIPGFTETSVYAKLLEASGIPYPDLCDRLVRLAIEKYEDARSYEF